MSDGSLLQIYWHLIYYNQFNSLGAIITKTITLIFAFAVVGYKGRKTWSDLLKE